MSQAVRPHLRALAARMEEMWAGRQLWLGERYVLFDAMLAAAGGGPPDLQVQVCMKLWRTCQPGTYNRGKPSDRLRQCLPACLDKKGNDVLQASGL